MKWNNVIAQFEVWGDNYAQPELIKKLRSLVSEMNTLSNKVALKGIYEEKKDGTS